MYRHILCTTFQPLSPNPCPPSLRYSMVCPRLSSSVGYTVVRQDSLPSELRRTLRTSWSARVRNRAKKNSHEKLKTLLFFLLLLSYPFLSFLHHNDLCVFVRTVYYSNVISKQLCIILVHVTGPFCGVHYCIIWCTIWFILWYPLPIR